MKAIPADGQAKTGNPEAHPQATDAFGSRFLSGRNPHSDPAKAHSSTSTFKKN